MAMVHEKVLLLVDDEANILRALARLLRRDGYTILTAGGGREGLEILRQHPVQVIVSDQRMPEMSGAEFLSSARELYPDTIRIALSGYTDLNSVTESVNKGAIYKFLTKPWEDDELRQHISDAFELYHKNVARRPANLDVTHRASDELVAPCEASNLNRKLTLPMLRLIIDALPQAILVFGHDGNVLCDNQKAQQWFGSSRAAVAGPPALLRDFPDEVLGWADQLSALGGHIHRMVSTPQGRQWDVNVSQLQTWPGEPVVMISLQPAGNTLGDTAHV